MTVTVTASASGYVLAPPPSNYDFAVADIDFGDGYVAHDTPAKCGTSMTARNVSKRYSATHPYAAPGTYTITFRVAACSPGPIRTATTSIVVNQS